MFYLILAMLLGIVGYGLNRYLKKRHAEKVARYNERVEAEVQKNLRFLSENGRIREVIEIRKLMQGKVGVEQWGVLRDYVAQKSSEEHLEQEALAVVQEAAIQAAVRESISVN